MKAFERYKSFIKFAMVGCMNTLVDFAIFSLFIFVGVDKLTAQVFAYTCGLINSFILNKQWTFKSKDANVKAEFIKFLPVNIISLGITLIGMQILNGTFGVNVYLSKVVVTVLAQLINYFGYKKLVFTGRPDKVTN